jgi:hypothetical protein
MIESQKIIGRRASRFDDLLQDLEEARFIPALASLAPAALKP